MMMMYVLLEVCVVSSLCVVMIAHAQVRCIHHQCNVHVFHVLSSGTRRP